MILRKSNVISLNIQDFYFFHTTFAHWFIHSNIHLLVILNNIISLVHRLAVLHESHANIVAPLFKSIVAFVFKLVEQKVPIRWYMWK